MATRSEIDATYNYMDRLWRASLGDGADITCALFDGDYAKSLDQAQRDKHDLICTLCGIQRGHHVLDIGCGWGGFLRDVRLRGAIGKGLTLSSAQAVACRAAKLDVDLCDWRDFDSGDGSFDAIASVGAFEHFASKEDFIAGEQGAVYRCFFERCRHLLKPNGRMFLQTMTWGTRVPHPKRLSVDATPGSDEYIVAVLQRFYPGSWLPSGLDQILLAASPWFRRIWVSNGRQDYIETMSRWGAKIFAWKMSKIVPAVQLLLRAAADRDLRFRLESLRHGYNRECFRRGIMDHYRIAFEAI